MQQSRPLGDGLFEFKTRTGQRLVYFYDARSRRRTIVTHGFSKGARVAQEIARGNRLRAEWNDWEARRG